MFSAAWSRAYEEPTLLQWGTAAIVIGVCVYAAASAWRAK